MVIPIYKSLICTKTKPLIVLNFLCCDSKINYLKYCITIFILKKFEKSYDVIKIGSSEKKIVIFCYDFKARLWEIYDVRNIFVTRYFRNFNADHNGIKIERKKSLVLVHNRGGFRVFFRWAAKIVKDLLNTTQRPVGALCYARRA